MNTTAAVRSAFATRLYHELAGSEAGKNLFLSPFSIQVALAMCAAGARGETRQVMTDLIGAPASVEEQNRQYAELLKAVNGDGDRPFDLTTANALWGQVGYPFKAAFQEDVAEFYDGAFHEVDYVTLPNEAVNTINAWVSDKTGARIKDLVNREIITPDTRLVLTNAIYFKGKWEKEFKKADTRNEDWFGPKGIRKVPMMHRKGDYLYCEGDGFQAVDLPYQGGQLSLLVVLPTNKADLTALETKLSAAGVYEQVTDALDSEMPVIVSLPRFKMETAFKLKEVLCALGAEIAFSPRADFHEISEDRLMISEVVHKAFVEVNEVGTEAAAATAVVMTRLSCVPMPAPELKVFQADHPFLFFIRDRHTNAVLFSGRVIEPT